MTKEVRCVRRVIELRCAGFDRRRLLPFLVHKIDIFRATKSPDKLSISAGHIFCPGIGGTKKTGHAPSGICRWRTANSFVFTKLRALGRSMGFMTKRGPRDFPHRLASASPPLPEGEGRVRAKIET